ncbi:hypothetical protein C1645_738928 [Glomus cerebriforme]|uniref:Uncharacterized protein n=1 Tax=Glomus cerebriforme TaxID=658196 RepID=A0A397SZ04_9GLOM|nr:hypothetical protein C1645_738928 [Glomus cerebriforme]
MDFILLIVGLSESLPLKYTPSMRLPCEREAVVIIMGHHFEYHSSGWIFVSVVVLKVSNACVVMNGVIGVGCVVEWPTSFDVGWSVVGGVIRSGICVNGFVVILGEACWVIVLGVRGKAHWVTG